ncbi:MAG: phage tail protein [Sphingomonadales bacterium]|nr:phage tail protein [Sphingomonadales bacterium]MDE2171169.1 phage tail protein [Sphingomonadales bacterium]
MGTNTVAPNVFWFGNFVDHGSSGKGGGGKGGGGKGGQENYTADVMMGICEGPISGIITDWLNNSPTTIGAEGLTLFTGDNPQAPWDYLVSNYPEQALQYNGVAYIAKAGYQLTSGATLQSHNFETQGFLAGTCGINDFDADPALCIQNLLTNSQWGAYFPSSFIETGGLIGGTGTSALQCYWKAIGLGLSPSLANKESAATILQRWLDLGNCTAFYSEGQLKFRSWSETSVSGNSYNWISSNAPLYDLNDDDFIAASNDDPVKIERIDVSSTPNVQWIEINDRTNYYAALPVPCRDECMVQMYGEKIGSSVTAHEICDKTMAAMVGDMMLRRALYIYNKYKFKLSWEYCLLEPMDVVTLTDANLGLAKTPVRIIDIEEDDQGQLTFTAQDFIEELTVPTAYPKQAITNSPLNQNVAAPAVNVPMIFEPPAAMTNGVAEIWVGASGVGGNANWGGAQVWVSSDGSSYGQIGTISTPATQGVLTAALGDSAASPDLINTLALDLSESAGKLLSTTSTNAQAGVTAALIDGEVLSYETATLSGSNTYNLTNLYRAQFGTSHAAHASGAPYCRLDDAIFKYTLPSAFIGKTIYLKLVSFNPFGLGNEDISAVTPYSFTPQGVVASTNLITDLQTGIHVDLGAIADLTQGNVNLGSLPVSGSPINLGAAH